MILRLWQFVLKTICANGNHIFAYENWAYVPTEILYIVDCFVTDTKTLNAYFLYIT